jgi:MurNAc alpha-1-phosphate uridylyltransferase
MGRFTRTLPKALIPVAGEPFLRHQLRLLAGQGVTSVVIATGYLGEQIEAEVARHSPTGMDVVCVPDGPTLLGTAGALRRLDSLSELDDSFMVVYGDSYLPIDHRGVAAAYEPHRYSALMTVLRNEGEFDQSNAAFADGCVSLYRKGVEHPEAAGLHWIDFGLSVLTRSTVLELVPPAQPHDLATVFERLSTSGRLQGFETLDRFYEVGSEHGLTDLEALLGGSQA